MFHAHVHQAEVHEAEVTVLINGGFIATPPFGFFVRGHLCTVLAARFWHGFGRELSDFGTTRRRRNGLEVHLFARFLFFFNSSLFATVAGFPRFRFWHGFGSELSLFRGPVRRPQR